MRSFIGSVVCTGALVVVGWVPTHGAVPQSASAKAPDSAIDARIGQRINADPSLKRYNIKVSVDSGVATLTGTVPTEADRAKAADLAKVSGVTRVDNKLLVDLDAGTKATTGIKEKTKEGAEKTKAGAEKVIDKTKEGAKAGYGKAKSGGEKAAEKTKEGAEKAVDATKKGVSKTGEAITDGSITTRVKADFINEDVLKGSDINADTNNHVVTLKGTVPSQAARHRAVAIAKRTPGVKSVVDQLTIAPKTP